MAKPQKVVFIMGTTAVGKSKLAIELAQRLRGGTHEVINADAMQVYKGLEIGSAQVTKEEMQGVPHHLLSFLDPTARQEFNVRDFLRLASPLITDIHQRGKLPIVCGGTSYYVENMLWKNSFLSQSVHQGMDSPPGEQQESEEVPDYGHCGSKELHQRLCKVDPMMAQRLHQNDRRKIMRSLQVYEKTGRPHSELLLETGGARGDNAELAYDAAIVWVDAAQDVRDTRINDRVDKMVENGLIAECESLHRNLRLASQPAPNRKGSQPYDFHSYRATERQYEFGIAQSIGFKEFRPYFEACEEGKPSEEVFRRLIKEGAERLKTHTKQYSRKQIRWLTNRMASPAVADGQLTDRMFRLDSSDIEQWDKRVLEPAVRICEGLLDGQLPPAGSFDSLSSLPSLSFGDTQAGVDQWRHYLCPFCADIRVVGQHQWQQHLDSRKHYGSVRSLKRLGIDASALPSREQIEDVSVEEAQAMRSQLTQLRQDTIQQARQRAQSKKSQGSQKRKLCQLNQESGQDQGQEDSSETPE